MELGSQSVLLLALREGPGFGLSLIERARARSAGAFQLHRGGVSLALRAFERRGLVKSWTMRLGAAGRPRRYVELTEAGITEADRTYATLRRFLEPRGGTQSAQEAERMAARVTRAASLSAFALRLRDAGRGAGL